MGVAEKQEETQCLILRTTCANQNNDLVHESVALVSLMMLDK